MSIGFLQATLEPHLRQFNLSPIILGLMFVINGGTYAVTAPAWGWLCDKRVQPKIATSIGCLLIAVGFSFIGPAPFVSSKTTISLTICGLVIHGLGMSAQLVASFTDALATSISHGFPNNLETYGLISGLWTSAFALGAFIGPSIAGILLDHIGFRDASMFIIILHLLVGCTAAVFSRCRTPADHSYSVIGSECRRCLTSIDSCRMRSQSRSIRRRERELPIDRPSGMNSLIACNSYTNRAGVWSRTSFNELYNYSYGSVAVEPYLERTA